MTYNEFLETMKTEVQNRLGEAYRVDLQDVIKTNDMVYNGLTIADKNINIAPTIYLNDMYEKYGTNTDGAVEELRSGASTVEWSPGADDGRPHNKKVRKNL